MHTSKAEPVLPGVGPRTWPDAGPNLGRGRDHGQGAGQGAPSVAGIAGVKVWKACSVSVAPSADWKPGTPLFGRLMTASAPA